MPKVLRSATKKCHNKDDLTSKLSASKKSRTIQRRTKKAINAKIEDKQQNDIWNINTILSNIFTYTDQKDLVEFNTVCKKWNNLSNPIIHKAIKLNRSWDIIKQSHDKRFNKQGKINADAIECISNNAKHAHQVKELKFNYNLEPHRAIEVFQTFKFICNLTIEGCEMSQDQFLGMISPLTQLQELNLSYLTIKRIIYKRLYKEVVQLPSSLKKLRLRNIILVDSPDLFIKTINSHRNLIEFKYITEYNNALLEAFYEPYPSLLNFEYQNTELRNPDSLIKVFEQNSQITILKLKLNYWNSELTSFISSRLTNLEDLSFNDCGYHHQEYREIFLKFSQPTKIKKLNLEWTALSNCSLDSILLNCPQLEELKLNRFSSYQRPNTEVFINLSKSVKLKKLDINCENLSATVLQSILLRCCHINELAISLPVEWKEAINSIYEICGNLQRLEISISNRIYGQERANLLQEIYETKIFASNSKCKSSLTHLTLNEFKVAASKAEHFKYFENLVSIIFSVDRYGNLCRPGTKIAIDMELWPGYKLVSKESKKIYNIEFKKF
jgi:hypothetical protein